MDFGPLILLVSDYFFYKKFHFLVRFLGTCYVPAAIPPLGFMIFLGGRGQDTLKILMELLTLNRLSQANYFEI